MPALPILPFLPPVPPMLARLARELPTGGFLYEPKWDGFRCLAFRARDTVDLRSRHDRPLARYFPEIVDGLRSLTPPGLVLDGEIVLSTPHGFDFPALMSRLHPAHSRVARLARETPAAYVAFDLLAVDGEDLRDRPFAERRTRLEHVIEAATPHVLLTPATDDVELATKWLERFEGGGVDGVMVKHETLRYEPGARTMVKVKREHTADCVVAGFRAFPDRPQVSSLLLGLYDERGALEHVGAVSGLRADQREAFLVHVEPLISPLEGHPWEHGFLLQGGPTGRLKGSAGRWTPDMPRDWVPLAPVLVCEAGYDQLDGLRFRHPARFKRWRPDREPASCTFDQLRPSVEPLRELLPLA